MSEDVIKEITPKAVEKIKQYVSEYYKETPDKEHMLRIYVEGGGCAGFQYGLMIESIEKDKVSSLEGIVEKEGIKVLIDPMSRMYLQGIIIDYVDGLSGSGFKLINPNATGGCGCGHSFSV